MNNNGLTKERVLKLKQVIDWLASDFNNEIQVREKSALNWHDWEDWEDFHPAYEYRLKPKVPAYIWVGFINDVGLYNWTTEPLPNKIPPNVEVYRYVLSQP